MTPSLDVELLRPTWAEGAPGISTPATGREGDWRVGASMAYTRDPVLLWEGPEARGAAVGDRGTLSIGGAYAPRAWLRVGGYLPLAVQAGDAPRYAANGPAIGDLRLAAEAGAGGAARLGGRVEVGLPSGTREAWMGEGTLRIGGAALAQVETPVGTVLADLGATWRPDVDAAEAGLRWGPTAEGGVGLVADAPLRLEAAASAVGRVRLDSSDAELALELAGELRWRASERLRLALGGGAGVLDGVGASRGRGWLAVQWGGHRVDAAPIPEVDIAPAPAPTGLLLERLPGEPGPAELAALRGDEIVLFAPIRFVQGSAELLPESLPVIDAVASVLAGDARLVHVAIEGHASAEGTAAANWDLSERRARSVWEALIGAGMHPDRASFRGMGELLPVDAPGADTFTESRRVVFRVVARAAEPPPSPDPHILLPWSGEAAEVDTPTLPTPSTEETGPTFEEEEEP